MSFHDLVVTAWHARFMGVKMPVSVGRGGIGEKLREGDNITPRGVFEVENWYARTDRISMPFDALKLRDGWSDDAERPEYNQMVGRPYKGSHERLFRADHLYDLIGVINYNRNPIVAGKGSAIFIHAWRRPRFPTEGCIAFAPYDLAFVAEHWSPRSKVVIQ